MRSSIQFYSAANKKYA